MLWVEVGVPALAFHRQSHDPDYMSHVAFRHLQSLDPVRSPLHVDEDSAEAANSSFTIDNGNGYFTQTAMEWLGQPAVFLERVDNVNVVRFQGAVSRIQISNQIVCEVSA